MLPIQIQTGRPQTTAHLTQTMTLLGMTSIELIEKVYTELANNPALEIIDEFRCLNCGRRLREPGLCPTCSRPHAGTSDQPIVLLSSRDYTNSHSSSRNSREDYSTDNIAPQIEDLPTFVLRQIAPELHPKDRNIAAHILTSLDDNGLLSVPLQEISMYHHVPISRVQQVLRQIQLADPIGVGSTNVKDALLVQLEVLNNYLSTNPVPEEVLMPVPLHRKRARERGYNQSDLLARELGKLIKLPVVGDFLIRKRHVPPQARTSTVGERQSNVAGAFSCRDQSLQNKQVLLIDDVATSGATLDACAAAMKSAGAISVWGLVLAREI